MLRDFRTSGRTHTIAVIVLAIMAIFVLRLFYLQVIQHDKYVTLANSEQLKRLSIPAKRGEIYMMDGQGIVPAVLNQTVYTLFVDPKIIKPADRPKIVAAINEVAGGNTVKDFALLLDKADTRYQIVAKKINRRQAELLKKRELEGVGFQAATERVYPEKSLAAQTLGFVNFEEKGQYGVESQLNDRLTGKDGLLQSVTDVSNVPLTIGNNNIDIPAQDGDNIVLTIDRNVQSFTEQALASGIKKAGATNGSAIVMDPNSGKVLAMANLPTYNPGEFTKVTDANAFNNGVVSEPYEPGSVMKTFTLATGIDTGTVTPESTYVNTDSIQIYDQTINNATKGQTGTITMQHALNWSLNTGMVTIAQRLGDGSINKKARSTMYSYLHDKFKLDGITGLEVAGEAPGTIIPPTEVEGNAVRYSNMSFGQGLNVTMLQVATSFSAMVNGGTYYSPTIVAGTANDGKLTAAAAKSSHPGVIKSSTSTKMQKMIVTARNAFGDVGDRPGYVVGGKTGTSQTIINGKYTFDQTTGTYLGFGGGTTPKYVIMVQVSGKGRIFSGNDARPIFTEISNSMIDYLKLQPKG